MQHVVVTAVVALCLSGTLLTQSVTKGARQRISREVEEKKRMMREGKIVRTSVRVTVRLRNGSRLRGVVRDGRFIERFDSLDFVPADISAPGAGLRLWYYDETNSYIFLPYESILHHAIGERLTKQEVKEIAKQFESAEKAVRERARRERERLAREAKAKDKDGEDPPEKDGAAGAEDRPKSAGLTPQQEALLAEYPPADGWGKDRMEQIETRKITLGVYPDKRGARFLEVFPQWNEAHQLQKTLDESDAPNGATGTGEKPKPAPSTGRK